jgi:hypothetical protein
MAINQSLSVQGHFGESLKAAGWVQSADAVASCYEGLELQLRRCLGEDSSQVDLSHLYTPCAADNADSSPFTWFSSLPYTQMLYPRHPKTNSDE